MHCFPSMVTCYSLFVLGLGTSFAIVHDKFSSLLCLSTKQYVLLYTYACIMDCI